MVFYGISIPFNETSPAARRRHTHLPSGSFPLWCMGSPQEPVEKKRCHMTMNLASAEAIMTGVRCAASQHGFRPLAVVVLDAGGHIIAAQREDGASNKRHDVAFGKAHGAVSLGMTS